MGLFDFLLSDEKKIQKYRRQIIDLDTQEEDREAACQWLSDNGSEKALVALCERFDTKLTQQVKDQKEKDWVFSLVASHGDGAIRPVRAFLKRCKSVSKPLHLFEELAGEETTLELVYDLLERELERDSFKSGRKQQLLVWLHERRDGRCIERATPFLKDFDENVRIAAAEVIIGQNDDAGRDPLGSVLAREEEDSNRLLYRIYDTFAQRGWPVEDITLARPLPSDYTLQNGRILK